MCYGNKKGGRDERKRERGKGCSKTPTGKKVEEGVRNPGGHVRSSLLSTQVLASLGRLNGSYVVLLSS